ASDAFSKSVFLIGFLIALFGFIRDFLVQSKEQEKAGNSAVWNYLLVTSIVCMTAALLLNFLFKEEPVLKFLFYLGFTAFNVSIWVPMIINIKNHFSPND
ncbi:MAG: hypothetical protein ACPGAE_12880, partial [Neptuniibacter sp.]